LPKINPFTLQRPAREVQVHTVVDAQHPEHSVTIALREMDAVDQHRAEDLSSKLVEKYITGKDKLNFIVGGESVALSEQLCSVAASLEVMQADHEGADRYTAEEFMAFAAVLPNLWVQLMVVAAKVHQRANDTLPNA
jgi:hypothetical protein